MGVGFEAEGEVGAGVGGADCEPGVVVIFGADAVDGGALVEWLEVVYEGFDYLEFLIVWAGEFVFGGGEYFGEMVEFLV